MDIQTEVISFNPTTGSLVVRYFCAEVPDGLIYNIDIPLVDNEFVGLNEINNLIELMKPTGQLERVKKLTEGIPNISTIQELFPNGNIQSSQPLDKAQIVRQHRNALLEESDYTQLPDVNMAETVKAAWVEYRQSLRDITSQSGFPDNISWPLSPDVEPS